MMCLPAVTAALLFQLPWVFLRRTIFRGKEGYVIAVIGDGALSGGLAYEGLNNAGRLHRNLIVILNDNNMSISRNLGSMASTLPISRTKPGYLKIKNNLESSLQKLPVVGKGNFFCAAQDEAGGQKVFYNSTIFEDFGFRLLRTL